MTEIDSSKSYAIMMVHGQRCFVEVGRPERNEWSATDGVTGKKVVTAETAIIAGLSPEAVDCLLTPEDYVALGKKLSPNLHPHVIWDKSLGPDNIPNN